MTLDCIRPTQFSIMYDRPITAVLV